MNAPKLEGDETVYLQLTNGRYVRFALGEIDGESAIEYQLYSPDGEMLIKAGKMEIGSESNIFKIVQTLLVYLDYREEDSNPMLYLPLKEQRFLREVAAA